MGFSQAVTLLALLTGPVGIWFGWWLAERSAHRRALESLETSDRAAEIDRVSATVILARQLAGTARSLAHGMYLKHRSQAAPEQLSETITEFNRVRDEYRNMVLKLRLLGPSWAVGPAQDVSTWSQRMLELIMRLQLGLRSNDIAQANSELPLMDAAVTTLTDAVSEHYNPNAAGLAPIVLVDDARPPRIDE